MYQFNQMYIKALSRYEVAYNGTESQTFRFDQRPTEIVMNFIISFSTCLESLQVVLTGFERQLRRKTLT